MYTDNQISDNTNSKNGLTKGGKHTSSVKNLLVACNAQTIKEAFEKATWVRESSGEHANRTRCHLCGTPHKYFVIARNLENGVLLTVGKNCFEKLLRFSIFGDFTPLPYEASAVTKIKKSHQVLLSFGDTVINWLETQDLPVFLRREVEYVKEFSMPSSIESSEALIHYYKHNRILSVNELFNDKQIEKAHEIGISLYSMTIAASENIVEILNMFDPEEIALGRFLGLEISTLSKTKAEVNKEIINRFKPLQTYIFSLDEEVSTEHIIKQPQDVEKIFKAISDEEATKKEARVKAKSDAFIKAFNNPEAKIEINSRIELGSKYLLQVSDDTGTYWCVISRFSSFSWNVCVALRHTLPNILDVIIREKDETYFVDPRVAKKWHAQAKKLMADEAQRMAKLFKVSDVGFTDDQIIFDLPQVIQLRSVDIWISTRNLKLEKTVPDRGRSYDFHRATITLKVPLEKVGAVIGKKGSTIKEIEEELGDIFNVRHLRIQVIGV